METNLREKSKTKSQKHSKEAERYWIRNNLVFSEKKKWYVMKL